MWGECSLSWHMPAARPSATAGRESRRGIAPGPGSTLSGNAGVARKRGERIEGSIVSAIGASFQIGRSALAAYQAAISVTGQNIANAGNPNYVRLDARLAALVGGGFLN